MFTTNSLNQIFFRFKSKQVTSQYIHTIRDHYIQAVELKTDIDST